MMDYIPSGYKSWIQYVTDLQDIDNVDNKPSLLKIFIS